ncbi:MAG: phosphatidate cytidylyltransferase [Lachnospiraceae bacterium]|nr:phosphatidate cytidylyltransferase [Lachnospiraceae bacterium]
MKNFWVRLGSSITLVAIALLTVFYGGYILAAVLLFTSLFGYRELLVALKLTESVNRLKANKGFKIIWLENIGYLTITFYFIIMLVSGEVSLLFIVVILSLIVFMAGYVFSYPRYHIRQIMEAFFCVLYAPVMLFCIYLTRSLENGIFFVGLIFISSWICDSCAYCIGMLFGRNKLAPKLSPKKSVEGAIGGILGAMGAGALYGAFIVNRLVPELSVTLSFAAICGIGAVIAQIGDLAASAIKRNYDIKDFGKLIPGHGGIMDRFDSVIFTAPVIYFLALLVG